MFLSRSAYFFASRQSHPTKKPREVNSSVKHREVNSSYCCCLTTSHKNNATKEEYRLICIVQPTSVVPNSYLHDAETDSTFFNRGQNMSLPVTSSRVINFLAIKKPEIEVDVPLENIFGDPLPAFDEAEEGACQPLAPDSRKFDPLMSASARFSKLIFKGETELVPNSFEETRQICCLHEVKRDAQGRLVCDCKSH